MGPNSRGERRASVARMNSRGDRAALGHAGEQLEGEGEAAVDHDRRLTAGEDELHGPDDVGREAHRLEDLEEELVAELVVGLPHVQEPDRAADIVTSGGLVREDDLVDVAADVAALDEAGLVGANARVTI